MQRTQRLFAWLPRFFSRDPLPFEAFRLRHDAAPATWQVRDGTLTAVATSDGVEIARVELNLADYTLAGLVVALATAGFTMLQTCTPAQASLSALCLLDAAGDQDASNGDRVVAWSSLLWAYLEPLALELDAADSQITAMLAQLNLQAAEGDWLDALGEFYGFPRRAAEMDAAYRARIVEEVLAPRGNNVAIAEAIRRAAGQATEVVDVVTYGAPTPTYNAAHTHNGAITHNATPSLKYGLFDVTTGYDLLGADHPTAYLAAVRDFVSRMRDAGTQLRAVALTGAEMTDALLSGSDGGDLAFGIGPILTDTLASLDDSAVAFLVSPMPATDTDPLPEAADAIDLTSTADITHNSLRAHNAVVTYSGGAVLESF